MQTFCKEFVCIKGIGVCKCKSVNPRSNGNTHVYSGINVADRTWGTEVVNTNILFT